MSVKKQADVFGEIIVGLFMVAVFSLLVYFTIVISGVDVFFGGTNRKIKIAFDNVGGLKERDSVVYRGMKVGTVDSIQLTPSNIIVTTAVSGDVVLRSGYKASVEMLSLLGGNYLLIDEGSGEKIDDRAMVLKGESPVDLMRDLGEIARNLSSLSSDGGVKAIVENLKNTSESASRIAARLERGEGTLGKLLSTNDTLYTSVASAAADAATIARRLERGEGVLGKLIAPDDHLYDDLKRAVSSFSAVASRIERGEGTLGRLTSADDTLYASLEAGIANIRDVTDKLKNGNGTLGRLIVDEELAKNTSDLIRNLKTVSERLERGEGSLGKLLSDKSLHDEVTALVKDLREIVDNYRDTTPISTFGSLIMGGL